jgi:hypothetical protein
MKDASMDQGIERSKVPEVTLVFWIVKILATTLGETGGDAVSMSMNLGYAVSSFIFIAIFAVAVTAQICAKKFHPVSLLAGRGRDHDGGHHHGRFRRPLARHRLSRRRVAAVRATDGLARDLVLVGRIDFGQHGCKS